MFLLRVRMQNAPIIRMINVTKKLGNQVAVDHLNLKIEKGEILGILGPACVKVYVYQQRYQS